MYIFIDESGSFAFPKDNSPSLSCVAALTVPETRLSALIQGYKKLKQRWGFPNREIKGSELNETHVVEFLDLLTSVDVILHVCATDMSVHTVTAVNEHKADQARRLIAHLTDKHQPALIAQLQGLSAQMGKLSPQLYVQVCMLTQLVARLLRDTSVYYAFANPKALGHFRWVIDAKARKLTTSENIWKLLIGGFLQSMALRKEVTITVDGGDYSSFERFCKKINRWPGHLPLPHTRDSRNGPVEIVDISKIMNESVAIIDSKAHIGLQLADHCANIFRRAVIGNLKYPSWHKLGFLMLKWNKPAINLVRFDMDPTHRRPVVPQFAAPILIMERAARFVLPP